MTGTLTHLPCCVIVGAGPAGLAPLFAAAYAGNLDDLLAGGVVIVERGDTVGGGALGQYAIRSDSAAEAFLDIVNRTTEPALIALQSHPLVLAIEELRGRSVPLTLASAFLRLAGETMCALVEASPNGALLRQHTALSARRSACATWTIRVRCEKTGAEQDLQASSLVLATGADQRLSRLHQEHVAGAALLPLYQDKLLQTGDVLSAAGLAALELRLASISNPRIVVVGGSSSAGAAARVLLQELNSGVFDAGQVTLMHRGPLRIFYNSPEEARADGYLEFGPEDICSLSGRLYRLAGFRLETRELIMGALGIGGRTRNPRFHLHLLEQSNFAEARQLLDDADLIIAGLGYRPRALPLFDANRDPLHLMAESDDMRPMIDEECRILDANSDPLQGVYGVGLASGFVPQGELGGEASFRGQANSLWLWQHEVGLKIVHAVIRDSSETQPKQAKNVGQGAEEPAQTTPRSSTSAGQTRAHWMPGALDTEREVIVPGP